MKIQIQFFAVVTALCLSGCASSSVKKTWTAPDCAGGPVQKIAVIAVEERGMVRKGFENRFVRDLSARGQAAVVTHDLLALPEIKADKEAATRTFSGTGADSVFIIRLVDQTSYSRQVEAHPEVYVPVTTGFGTDYGYYGWYNCYTVAFMNMGASWGNTKQQIYLDSSLYDLKSGKRLWSTLTETTIKEDADRLVEADKLVAKVVASLQKAGLVR
jgi:hypothetical protein